MRLQRSQLSTPGSSPKMMAKAAASEADFVFLDLEDSVSPLEKPEARRNVVTALRELDWTGKTRAVRINSVDTEHAYQDIITIVEEAGEHLDVIIVPKVFSSREVQWVDTLITQIETRFRRTRPVKLQVLIEEVQAMVNAAEIAASTPRLEALIFGMGDYAASQGVDVLAVGGESSYPGDMWHYARNQVIVAARAAGIEMLDGPWGNIADLDGYQREAQRAKTLGAVGKWAIHPNQIAVANEVFTPDPDHVTMARDLAAAYAEAEAAGKGAVSIGGFMVDAATIRIVRNLIDKADLIDHGSRPATTTEEDA
jgi:citrate lyase subunit beta/citryl-CoA lyase